MNLRDYHEHYHLLDLLVLPAKGKYPVSYVLDEAGRIARGPDGKPERWKSFQTRFPTDAEWNAAQWHRATGLALVNGPATWRAWPHLWVLDAEARHRVAAEAWLDQNVPGWRDGVVVETGSGGIHVYLLHDKPVETDSMIEWGEIRGRAAICVLPPSIHPITGRRYRFLSERWQNLPALDPATVPGATDKQRDGFRNEPGWFAAWFRTSLPEGSRRGPDGLPKGAGHLHSLGHDCESCVAILESWNSRNKPPLPADELRRQIEDMFARWGKPGVRVTFSEKSGRASHKKTVRVA